MTAKRQARIEKWRGTDGQWYWHCIAPNGRIVMDGAEGYSSERAVGRGIDRAAKYIAAAIAAKRVYVRPARKPKRVAIPRPSPLRKRP